MWAAVLATAAVTPLAAPRALIGQVSDDATPRPTTGPATATAGTSVADLRAALTSPATPPAVRNEAARRLLTRGTPEARAALRDALRSAHNAAARAAAARALADDPRPDPALIPDLLALLNNDNERAGVEAAALALANYKGDPQVLAELSGAATRPDRKVNLRVPAIRALGTLVEPAAAATLERILTTSAEPAEVRAAAEALVELTGLEANGRDVARWQQWFQQNRDLPEAAWKANVLNTRARRQDRLRREAEQTSVEIAQLLEEQHAAAADKAAVLLRYLNSPAPEVRRVGARIAGNVERVGGRISEAARDRMLDLLGDADPAVRIDVALSLYDIFIPADRVLPPLLAQLRVETDGDVKVAIIRRLGRIPGAGQMQDLIDLLGDPSPTVVRAAAEAIEDRIADVTKDAALSGRLAARLRETLVRIARQRGAAAVEARRAVGETLALLRDPVSFKFAVDLLGARPESLPDVRGVALHILGELGPEGSDIIIRQVETEKREPAVRLEGMKAIGRARSFEQAVANWLADRMDRKNEPNEAARKAARETYLGLIRYGTTGALANQAQRRKPMPDVREALQRELIDKLKAERRFGEAAHYQESLGENLLKDQRKYAEAVVELRGALDFWRKQNGLNRDVGGLLGQLIDAMLLSRKYGELIALAQDLITDSPAQAGYYQQEFGTPISRRAEQLKNEGKLDDARALIDAALKMDPPLDPFYVRGLKQIRADIDALRQPGAAGAGAR
jgi:HEAT repeat protein